MFLSKLFRFMKDYWLQKKQIGAKNLAAFYKDYHPKFRPKQDAAGFVIEIFNQLKEKHSVAAKYFYLVSVYPNVPTKFTKAMPSADISNVVPNPWYHESVAGNVFSVGSD